MSNEAASKEVKLVDVIPVPRIHDDLLAFLDQNFPERCPDIDQQLPEIYFKAGQRSVVRYLIRLYEEQNDNVL